MLDYEYSYCLVYTRFNPNHVLYFLVRLQTAAKSIALLDLSN